MPNYVPGETITVRLSDLTPDPKNVRRHNERNIGAIMSSLNRWGQQKPIVVSTSGVIFAGNGTFEAAEKLGWETIEARVSSLQEEEAMAYAIADNKTSDLGEWDFQDLSEQLRLFSGDMELLAATGWQEHEIDPLLAARWEPPPIADLDDQEDNGTEATLPEDHDDRNRHTIQFLGEQWELVDEAIQKCRTINDQPGMAQNKALELICAEFLGIEASELDASDAAGIDEPDYG